MGAIFTFPEVPQRSSVQEGKERICVSGWPASPHVTRASTIARTIQKKFPDKYETWFYFTFGPNLRGPNGDGQGGLYSEMKNLFNAEDKAKLQAHKSVPFVWIETSNSIKGIGGRDNLCEWIIKEKPDLMADEEIKTLVTTGPNMPSEVLVDTTPGSVQAPLEKAC